MSPAKIPVLILAGGLGTRISEETSIKPKPMIEIGDIPVLLHIMRRYHAAGFDDFVICAGYKAWEIKKYFLSYELRCNDLEIDHRKDIHVGAKAYGHNLTQEKWRVRVLATGVNAMTGSRVAKALDVISLDQKFDDFALTYGDGLSNVDLNSELKFHMEHKKIGTVLGVKHPARFGVLDVNGTNVEGFLEKPESKQDLISGGYFFFKKSFRSFLEDNEDCILERKPLEQLAKNKELVMYEHKGFWHPMDTLRDKIYLQGLWDKGSAPWVG